MTMLPLKINISDIVSEFCLSAEEEFELNRKIISTVSIKFMEKWESLVDNELKRTCMDYKKAMEFRSVRPNEITFSLNHSDTLANDIENGKGAYDMKSLYKDSGHVQHTMSGGWYVTIPFRYATSKNIANLKSFVGVMPRGIYDAARNSGEPLRQQDLGRKYATAGRRPGVHTPYGFIKSYRHKSPIFLGLVKLDVEDDRGAIRSGYFTFRKMSNNSDPMSWMNRGIKAHNFIQRTENSIDVDEIADTVINDFLKRL